jgi:hypothetical protein
MKRNTARFHDHVIVDNFKTGVPGGNLRRRSAQRDGQFLIARFEGAIAQVKQYLCSFILPRAAIVNYVIRNLAARNSFGATTARPRKQVREH